MHSSPREFALLVLAVVSIGAYYQRHREKTYHTGQEETVPGIDRICFTTDQPVPPPFPEKPAYKATAQVDVGGPSHAISDNIYGVCSLPENKLSRYEIGITRWGGNTSSRYNWKINADSGANDWYFKNRGKPMDSLSENAYLKLAKSAKARNATVYVTVPTLGWVAKDFGSYSFPVRKFGLQKATEPDHPDVGNGVRLDGQLLRNVDPRDTSIAVGPDFIAEAVDYVVKNAGKADEAGVKYWVLDNEPMLWHETHRDVCPLPMSYDELWERTVKYAEAIRQVDPSAKIAGFCSWGWTDLFFSARDQGDDMYASQPDHRAHHREPLAEWFIRKCGEYRAKHGKPLVDVFDFHWYPQCQAQGVTPYLGKGQNVELNELRLRCTADLWDPYYTQESWIRETVDRKPTQVIRRVRAWIERHNPGMEICVGEYNFGGGDNVTGGLAQADVLGILGREKVNLAFIWDTPQGTQELAWKLFRDYDGQGGRFGDESLDTSSEHRHITVHAAKRKDGATTIVAINKNLNSPCALKIDATGLKGTLQIWRFDQTSGGVIEDDAEPAAIDGTISVNLPAASASMLVVK